MRKESVILVSIIAVVTIGAVLASNYYRTVQQSQSVTTNTNTGKPKAAAEQLVRPDSKVIGPADAKVTLVEFYDPECEACAAIAPAVKKLLADYEGRLRLVSRYMALHPNSVPAATFTEAAGEQGKYWEAQELLFKKQPEWGTKHGRPSPSTAEVTAFFKKYATELGLDQKKMDAAAAENRFTEKIERDKKDGQTLGVKRTPTFFVNGRELMRFAEADLRSLIEDELKK